MKEIEGDYNEYNNQGVKLLENGKNNFDKLIIESAIQCFKKSIAISELEGIHNFEIAQNNLILAIEELNKLKNK